MQRGFFHKRLVPFRNSALMRPEEVVPSQILLVEDDYQRRGRTAIILGVLGYRVTATESADRALELAEAPGADFDALVTELKLPGMSGPELASRLRKRIPELAVLFLSGDADAPEFVAQALGVSDRSLCRPFTPEQLERELGEFPDLVSG